MLLEQSGVSWDNLDLHLQRGRCVYKDADGNAVLDKEIPLFTENREYIEKTFEL